MIITKFKKRISNSLDTKILGAKLFFNKSAIVVYQMGKVGSTTVYYSLKKQLPFTPVFHVHCLSDHTLKEQEESYYEIGKMPKEVKHLRQGKFLNKQLNKSANIKWKIVTLVREPIIREISIFFQQINRDFPKGINTIDIISILQKRLAKFEESTDFVCNWFDREIKNNFNVNVYDFDFDKEAGYHIIRTEKKEILIIRLEDLNNCFQTALSDFLLIDNQLNMLPKNMAAKKQYKEQYMEVVNKIRIPRNICESIYSSKYVKHFYGDDLLNKFIHQWTKE